MTFLSLSLLDLLIVSLFVFANGALSIWLSLGISRQLFVAAARMVVQLLAVGALLTALFGTGSLPLVGLMALGMTLFAARELSARQERPIAGWPGFALATATMATAAGTLTLLSLVALLQPTPWYDPRFAIPLFGMILGNAMTGISLGLDTMTTGVYRERAMIEARLALGHPRLAALRPIMNEALRRGLLPTINSMAATGVVFLPGMMTGQILAGVPPWDAVRYQLFIMFLIAGATGLGLTAAVLGAARLLTDDRHRLRPERLARRP